MKTNTGIIQKQFIKYARHAQKLLDTRAVFWAIHPGRNVHFNGLSGAARKKGAFSDMFRLSQWFVAKQLFVHWRKTTTKKSCTMT